MHRDHRFAQRLMPAAMDQGLGARQQARFARHVGECPECGPMLRGLIRIRAAMRSLGEPPSDSASIVPAVLERLRSERAADARGSRSRRAPR